MDRAINLELLAKLVGQLSVPPLANKKLTLCGQSLEEFSHFIGLLPENAPADTAKPLYSVLSELGGMAMLPREKLALLNEARPITTLCATKLSRTRLSPQTAKAISLSQALLKHLACGYRSVIKGFAMTGGANLAIPYLSQAILFSLEAQGLMYLKSRQFYLGTPQHFWSDFHTLFRIAMLCQITSEPNPGRASGGSPPLSIRSEYLRTLLIACSQPNHLSSNDLGATYEALKNWAEHTSIVSGQSPGLFVIDPESDLPPFYASKVKGSKHSLLKIHTPKLIDYLEGRLRSFPDAAVIDQVPPRLIRTLCESWTCEHKRQEKRLDETRHVKLIYGLSFIHNQLSGKQDFDQYLDSMATFAQGRKKREENEPDEFHRSELFSNDVWHNRPGSGPGGRFRVTQESLESPDLSDTETKPKTPEPLTAYILNSSANGSCLELRLGKVPKLAPGDVIATRNEANNSWRLGVVRWKRTTPKLTTLLGVEFFSGTPSPRAARIMNNNHTQAPYLPALQLDSDNPGSQLVVTVMPFKHGDQIHLLGGGDGQLARLSLSLDSTGFIGRFVLCHEI